MARLNNRFKVPSIPIFWTYGKTRIEWRPAQSTFYDWMNAIHAFCDGNGINPKPTEEQLEAVACQQIPSSYCDGGVPRQSTQRASQTVGRSHGGGGCCGGRH